MKIWFSHGKDGSPTGDKIQMLAKIAAERGWQFESIDYRGMEDPRDRVEKLLVELRQAGEPVTLVGSSLGGHVATTASMNVECLGLFLLAPAFYYPGYEEYTPAPNARHIEIIHGWNDDVIPVDNSVRWAREHAAVLHIVNGGHRLDENLQDLAMLFGVFLQKVEKLAASAS